MAIADVRGIFALQVITNYRLGLVHFSKGDYRKAGDFLRAAVESLEGGLCYERFDLPFIPAVISRAWSARCLAELGRFDNALVIGKEAVEIAAMYDLAMSVTSSSGNPLCASRRL